MRMGESPSPRRAAPRQYDRYVSTPALVVGAIAEILSWVGGFVLVIGVVALLIISAAQGPWRPVEAIVERDGRPVLRWFGANAVGEARVAAHDVPRVEGHKRVTVFVRSDRHDRFRWTRRGPAWRPVLIATIAAAGLWVVATIVSFLPYVS